MNDSIVTLMRRAIGNRTIAEFALQSNVAPEKISNCLYDSELNIEFSIDELHRIANNSYNGVTLYDFLHTDVCIDISTDMSRQLMTSRKFIQMSKLFMESIKFQLEHLDILPKSETINSEYSLIKKIISISHLYTPDVNFRVGIDLNHTTPESTVVQLSWSINRYVGIWEFVIKYKEEIDSEPGIDSIQEIIFDNDEVYKYGATIQLIYDDTNEGDPYWLVNELSYPYAVNFRYISKSCYDSVLLAPVSSEQKLIDAIFGKSSKVRTIEGYGFRLPDELKLVKDFCSNHRKESRINNSNMTESEKNEYSYAQYCMIISNTIKNETGICVYYYGTDEGNFIIFPAKFPWELYDSEKYLSKKTLYSVLDKYARELRSTVQQCYCKTTGTVNDEFSELENI